jgi:hypothetical protein
MCTVHKSRTCSPGPGLAQTVRSQDVETPSHYESNPVSYIANAGGGTQSDSDFRRPAILALKMSCDLGSGHQLGPTRPHWPTSCEK